jgi:serine/threonine protein kinase
MGEVYVAYHTHLKRPVALKTVTLAPSAGPEAISRFYREMEAVGRVQHQNVVRATDAREFGGSGQCGGQQEGETGVPAEVRKFVGPACAARQ